MSYLNSNECVNERLDIGNCHLCRIRLASIECKSCGSTNFVMKLCEECDILLHKTSLKFHNRKQLEMPQKEEKHICNKMLHEIRRLQNKSSLQNIKNNQNNPSGFLTSRNLNLDLINSRNNENNIRETIENDIKTPDENFKDFIKISTTNCSQQNNQIENNIYELTKFQENNPIKIQIKVM